MKPASLLQQYRLNVSVPSLSDTASDFERLQRALLPILDSRPVQPSLASLQDLGPALRLGEWQVSVTLTDAGDSWRLVRVNPAQSKVHIYGLAVDLGTTTVVGELIEPESGKVLASRIIYNGQRQFGVDVTTRMMYAEKKDGLTELRQAILNTMNELIATLCTDLECHSDAISAIVIAGNTIMMHLLLGFDPSSIRRDPYVPTATVYPILSAVETGINAHPGAPLYLFPAASGYVGGDVTAGLLATGISDKEATSILIDIGTNGETILGNRDFLLACSGSAGSAFEGCGLRWGMAAQLGAIDRVWVTAGNELAYQTVGGEPARGICGSGLIEALGAFLQSGAIDRSGKVNRNSSQVILIDGNPEVMIAPENETAVGENLTLRQGDIDNLIRDKAALFAGSRILLANADLSFIDVDEILIAGNFGQSLEVEQAVRIGLLPDIPRERIHFIGNSSLAGARSAILSAEAWQKAQKIAASLTCLELTAESRYFEEYTAALFLPHTNLDLFPSLI